MRIFRCFDEQQYKYKKIKSHLKTRPRMTLDIQKNVPKIILSELRFIKVKKFPLKRDPNSVYTEKTTEKKKKTIIKRLKGINSPKRSGAKKEPVN